MCKRLITEPRCLVNRSRNVVSVGFIITILISPGLMDGFINIELVDVRMEGWRKDGEMEGRMMERCRDEGRGAGIRPHPSPPPPGEQVGACMPWPATVGDTPGTRGLPARKGRQHSVPGGTHGETLHFT